MKINTQNISRYFFFTCMHPLYHQIAVQLNCLLSNEKLFDFHINSLESLYHYLGDGQTMQKSGGLKKITVLFSGLSRKISDEQSRK